MNYVTFPDPPIEAAAHAPRRRAESHAMSAPRYINGAQQRLLKLTLALFGDIITGYTPGELCRLTGATPHQMTRDLANLLIAGLATRDDDGRYCLTPRLPQQAVKVYAALGRAETRLTETRAALQRSADY